MLAKIDITLGVIDPSNTYKQSHTVAESTV